MDSILKQTPGWGVPKQTTPGSRQAWWKGRIAALPAIYRIVSWTSKSPWMTFWASLSVGTSEPPASQVRRRSRARVAVSCRGTTRGRGSVPGQGACGAGLEESPRAGPKDRVRLHGVPDPRGLLTPGSRLLLGGRRAGESCSLGAGGPPRVDGPAERSEDLGKGERLY